MALDLDRFEQNLPSHPTPPSPSPSGHENAGHENPAPSIPDLRTLLARPRPHPRRRAPNPLPYPETPPLLPPPPPSSLPAFEVPRRRILSRRDLDLFVASPTHALVRAFVFSLSESVAGTACSAVTDDDCSDTVRAILDVLDEAEGLVALAAPDEQAGSRFGNPAFRGYLDLVRERAPAWNRRLGVAPEAAVAEASAYLAGSLGDRDRIDYGSGHELNFVLWLLCLYQLGLVAGPADLRPLVLRVFARYLVLARALQLAYYLEPAGSHGVWGLDDYQFLPFLFGASQLLGHRFITPLSVHQDLTVEQYGADYLYLGQVGFASATKTVRGLRWHSPMLDDISAAGSWEKIEGGMRRMFVAEVLGKLPVMQHFLFGGLISAAEGMSGEGEEDGRAAADGTEEGEGGGEAEAEGGGHHRHEHGYGNNYGGDCCGIKVPSSVAAAEEMRKRGQGGGLRRIPFD